LNTRIHAILTKYPSELLDEWLAAISSSGVRRDALMKEGELRDQAAEFLRLLTRALEQGAVTDINTPAYASVRDMLERLSRSRSLLGFSPTETATFVFSLKQPLFERLRREYAKEPQVVADELWAVTHDAGQAGPVHHRNPPAHALRKSSPASSRR
jgi:rsbT co-antagonist protein RsbR